MNDLLTEGSIVQISDTLFTFKSTLTSYDNGVLISRSIIERFGIQYNESTHILTNVTDFISISLYKNNFLIYNSSYLINKKVTELLKKKESYGCKLDTLVDWNKTEYYLSIIFKDYSYTIPVSDNFVSYYKMCDKFSFNKLLKLDE